MELVGARILVDPGLSGSLLLFALGGALLGVLSGLTPGLHANNFALLLAASASSIPGPPTHVGAAMLAAGVVHTFLDVIPALALGVPDAAMSMTALPAHRLVIEGRGREALRLSALGSALAVVFAIPLALPITAVMVRIYPVLRPRISIVLAILAVYLVATERSRHARIGAAASFLASAGLGFATLDREVTGLLDAGGMLAPLFAGLFGAPVLLDAATGAGVPKQDDTTVTVSRRWVLGIALAGTISGAAVGYLPGVSSAIAATVVLAALPTAAGARGFVVATSGVNTANAIFALFALVALGTPRTGVLVAVDNAGVPLDLPILLLAIGLASVIGFLLVPILGDWYLGLIRGVNYAVLSGVVLTGLLGLAVIFAGPTGGLAFVVASVIGLLPVRVGARRVHLMGVLMGPLIIG